MPIEAFFHYLVSTFYYLGIFIINVIVSASIFFPIPGIVVITGAAFLGFNPILLAIVSAGGSMVGELVSYFAGFYGTKLAEKVFKKHTLSHSILNKHFQKKGALLLLIFGILPLPFDFVAIIAGSFKYKIWKFMLYGFIGKSIRIAAYIYLALHGFNILEGLWWHG